MSEEHVMQELDDASGTIYLRCPHDPKGWQHVSVDVRSIETNLGIYEFNCPSCGALLVWYERQLR